ncbi:MAG TPA: arsenic transporter [Candidatus Binataceae bacterium]|nr:arsenic transporter [Candidatus Binataceae bacterium]
MIEPTAGIWALSAAATAGIIVRPFAWPECIWPLIAAVVLVTGGLLPPHAALRGIARGGDVYAFLLGMMLLAELAREEGLFHWLAVHATRLARGSPTRLFALIFAVGTLVTTFLSNDATAVVLTPAVAAVVQVAEVSQPLPYLLICAFIANAASFLLPISNPANLVIYGSRLPSLFEWLPRYTLASGLAIAATYLALRFTQRNALRNAVAIDLELPALRPGAVLTAVGITATAAVLMVASAYGSQLGLPTLLAGLATSIMVLPRSETNLATLLKALSWNVLLLVAGLFVIVEALDRTGITGHLARLLGSLAARSAAPAAWVSGISLALGSNLVNNLPAGLFAGRVAAAAHAPEVVRCAILIGVDLGPNLSVTGSLATILWLGALRRDGYCLGAWQFLKLGAIVMPPALLTALLAILAIG